MLKLITPAWPAPPNISAFMICKQADLANFKIVAKQLNLPAEPRWLHQVHGTRVVNADTVTNVVDADASFTTTPETICAVYTADCLPLLICDKNGTEVAAIHAGWRGLAAGIIEQTLNQLSQPKTEFLVWLGPAISAAAFEVGEEVRQQFLAHDLAAAQAFIPAKRPGYWLADLYQLARQRLQNQGITKIYGGDRCTFSEPDYFYSYRRDGGIVGNMASLIWFKTVI